LLNHFCFLYLPLTAAGNRKQLQSCRQRRKTAFFWKTSAKNPIWEICSFHRETMGESIY